MAKLLITAVVAAAALACAFAPGAFAATPFTAGQGGGVHIVTSSDGAGHVAWVIPARGADPAKVAYCHIPPGGSACGQGRARLRFPGGASERSHRRTRRS